MEMVILKYLLIVLALFSFSVELECCESNCLLSRLEYFPCDYRHPNITAIPGVNEYGDYETRFTSECRCDIIRHRHVINPLPSASTTCGSIFFIRSPNKLASPPYTNYKNEKITFYNIQCAPEELIYIYMTEMDIEDTKCLDENVNSMKCVDYVEVRTVSSGVVAGGVVTNNCGADKTNLDGNIIQSSSIQTIFRSDPQNRFPGFDGVVECFNPSIECFNISSTESQTSQTQSWAEECEARTHKRMKVPYGQNVLYEVSSRGSNLIFVESLTNRTIKTLQISPIRYLMVRSLHDTQLDDATKREAGYIHTTTYYSPYLPTLLRGPGILYVSVTDAVNFACFQDYIKDTSKFKPSVKNKKLIREINYALKQTMLDNGTKTWGESSTTSNINTLQEDRSSYADIDAKSSDPLPSMEPSFYKTDVVSDQVYLRALKANLSDPILKVSVDLLLEALQRDNPKRLEVLKQEAGKD